MCRALSFSTFFLAFFAAAPWALTLQVAGVGGLADDLPQAGDPAGAWYHKRFINDFGAHTSVGTWTRYTTFDGRLLAELEGLRAPEIGKLRQAEGVTPVVRDGVPAVVLIVSDEGDGLRGKPGRFVFISYSQIRPE